MSRKNQRRKKRAKMEQRSRKRRMDKGTIAFFVASISMGIAIVVLALGLLFYVQKIEISGNDYTEDQVITETIESSKLSFNSLYDVLRFRFTDPEIPGSLSSMRVRMKKPWVLKVTVEEKPIIGYFKQEEDNVYFDAEGFVVKKDGEVLSDIPCIEGVDIQTAKLYQKLKMDNAKNLKAILSVAQMVKGCELAPDRIVSTDTGIELYFGNVCVMLGFDVTKDKIAQIEPVLSKLEGQAGTLHLEHYEGNANTITFTKAVEEAPVEESISQEEEYDESYDEDYDDYSDYDEDYYDYDEDYYDDYDEDYY